MHAQLHMSEHCSPLITNEESAKIGAAALNIALTNCFTRKAALKSRMVQWLSAAAAFSGSKAVAAPGSPPGNNLAAVPVAQPVEKAVPVLAHTVAWLVCALVHVHDTIALLLFLWQCIHLR